MGGHVNLKFRPKDFDRLVPLLEKQTFTSTQMGLFIAVPNPGVRAHCWIEIDKDTRTIQVGYTSNMLNREYAQAIAIAIAKTAKPVRAGYASAGWCKSISEFMTHVPFGVYMKLDAIQPHGLRIPAGIMNAMSTTLQKDADFRISRVMEHKPPTYAEDKIVKPKFRVVPMKSSDYANGVVIGNMIQNYDRYQQEFHHDAQDVHIRTRLMMAAFKDNRKKLKDILGPRSCQWTGEFKFDIWRVHFEDDKKTELLVLSARHKGTCYEVIVQDGDRRTEKNPDTVMNFIKWIAERVMEKQRGRGGIS